MGSVGRQPLDAAGRSDSGGLVDRFVPRRPSAGALVAVVAVFVATAAAVLTVQAIRPDHQTLVPADLGQRWEQLPASPLSARHDSLAVALDDHRVLVLGGFTTRMCPPNASCAGPAPVAERDGALFDLGTRTWKAIASAPESLPGHLRPAVVAGQVHLLTQAGRHLSYDPLSDRWSTLPGPDHATVRGLVAAGDTLVAGLVGDYAGEGQRVLADATYDPVRRVWTSLPVDPLLPVSGMGRNLVWTGSELVALSSAASSSDGHEPPYLRAAALDLRTHTWRRFPQAEHLMFGSGWTFDGRRLVNPSRFVADGGEVEPWPAELHEGGFLDPRTGTWSSLPTPPPRQRQDPNQLAVTASSERFKGARDALLDTQSDTWLPVESDRPDGIRPFGAQTWVGDTLFVWGGVTAYDGGRGAGENVATGGLYGS